MNRRSKTTRSEFATYQIRIKGHLGSQWADWFDNAMITLDDNGETLITCKVVDQSALYGLLKKVRDLGLLLISLNLISVERENASYLQQDRARMKNTNEKE